MCSEYQVKIADAGFAQAAATRAGARHGRAGGERRRKRPRAVPGLRLARARGWPTCWPSAPCSTSSGSPASAAPTPGGAPLGAGDLPVLPRHRPQPQAGVRPDRVRRHLRPAPGRRRPRRRRWASPRRGRGDPHLGDRRDPHLERQRVPRLLQESGGHRARARRRLAPHRRRGRAGRRRATWW